MVKPTYGKQRSYHGAYSKDDSLCDTGVGLDDTAYNPGPKPNVYVSNLKGKNSINLSYLDADTMGSGPVSDGRNVAHKPLPVPDSNDPGTPSKR